MATFKNGVVVIVRHGKDVMEWAADKLLKGAGAGSDPTEIDPGSVLIVAETGVYNAAAPTSWTDLDLSAVVGSNVALIMLKIISVTGQNLGAVAVRKNGDTDEYFWSSVTDARGVALGSATRTGQVYIVLLVAADTTGVIEWKAERNETTTIDIMAYIK